MKLPTKSIIAAVAIVLLLALSTYRWLTPAANAGRGKPGAVEVDFAAVGHADIPVLLEGLGTVQSLSTVTVHARVDGELQLVAFTEGQLVHRGDLLAQIDPRPNRAALDQALAVKDKDTALLGNAQRDLKRYEELEPQNLASDQTVNTQRSLVEQLTAQLKVDQAIVDNAKTQLEYTRITSPIDGRTGIRLIDQGNIIHAADPGGLVVITQIQPISVVFTLPEEKLGAVASALASGPVEVTANLRGTDSPPELGHLVLIDNQIDQATGTVKLKAIFANASKHLWPGQYVTALLRLRTETNALVIPSTAVMTGPSGPFAYVIKDDSTVEVHQLTTAEEYQGQTVVTSGLKQGDRVVTSNQYRLQPGAHVTTEHRTEPEAKSRAQQRT